jgi:hypothetical protein
MYYPREKIVSLIKSKVVPVIKSKDESWLSAAEKLAVILALGWAAYTFLYQKEYTEIQASIHMNSQITDQEFMQSLNNILYKEYDFRCQKKLDRPDIGQEDALEFFSSTEAADNISLDESFLIVFSRLDSVARCVKEEICSQEYSSNTFPYPVVQAIEYMVPYLKYYSPEGIMWTLGEDVDQFLQQYRPVDPWGPESYGPLCGPKATSR